MRQWDLERFISEASRGDFVWAAGDLSTLAVRAWIVQPDRSRPYREVQHERPVAA